MTMLTRPSDKYRAFKPVGLADRRCRPMPC